MGTTAAVGGDRARLSAYTPHDRRWQLDPGPVTKDYEEERERMSKDEEAGAEAAVRRVKP